LTLVHIILNLIIIPKLTIIAVLSDFAGCPQKFDDEIANRLNATPWNEKCNWMRRS